MENHIVLKILLFSTPQFFVSILMTYGFLGKKMNFKIWTWISIVVAISQHFIRENIDNFIIYTIILLWIDIIIGIMVNKGYIFKWIISVLLSESISATLEFVFIQLLILIFNINPLDFSKDMMLAFKCFIPQIIVHFLIAIIVYRKRITVFVENR
ncbi:hypothetical protein [Anaerophilus nitritogenes]|uniref:hypothetical protein n=1 Tax=Anaerophilus nitritogenes TaxID=2498136 RepID=UPI00101DDF68|nr:hypothetical protein [Anaerophilus nitritogenes]